MGHGSIAGNNNVFNLFMIKIYGSKSSFEESCLSGSSSEDLKPFLDMK